MSPNCWNGRLFQIFAVIGLAVVIGLCVALLVLLLQGDSVPGKMVLRLDLKGGICEMRPASALGRALQGRRGQLRDLVDAIRAAAGDERVVALCARLGGRQRLAQVQELRDALLVFHRSKKPMIAFAPSLGNVGSAGNVQLYLASAFDEIYVQPSGQVALQGVAAQPVFLKGSLDMAGLVMRMDGRKEYKTMKNMFTETKYTKAHREADRRLVSSLWGQIVRAIAASRKLSGEAVQALADGGPLSAQDALAAKLVDGLAYQDEVIARIEKKVGKDVPFIDVGRYLGGIERPNTSGTPVALVYAVGQVRTGKSGYDPYWRSQIMGSDTVSEAIRKVVDDETIKALVLRVDSPGGSYLASDTIWREVVRAREKGKVVIASMGTVAASGGYFVAMAADAIVAQPATLTGSIGVLTGKPVLTKLFQRVGLSFDGVRTARHADMWSFTRDFDDEEWALLQKDLDRVYADFTTKAAKGRKMPLERLEKVARGRVWTGEDAKERGLVDELGGLETALGLVRKRLKLAPDASLQLQVHPRPQSKLVSQLLAKLTFAGAGPDSEGQVQALAETARALEPALGLARRLAWPAASGRLRMATRYDIH